MTTALTSQILGLAGNASRALLERALTSSDLTYGHWVTLKLAADNAPTVDRAALTGQAADGVKVTPEQASACIADLTTRDLLATTPGEQSRVGLTPTGQALYTRLSAELAPVTARVYRDLPPDDLATAGRVLTTITTRINAELDNERR